MSPENLVRVFAAPDQALLAVTKSLLDAHNIPYTVTGEQISAYFGVFTGPPEVWVRREDSERASALLRRVTERTPSKVACSYCGSRELVTGRPALPVMLLGTGFALSGGLIVEGMRSVALGVFAVTIVVATILYARVGRNRCSGCGRVRPD